MSTTESPEKALVADAPPADGRMVDELALATDARLDLERAVLPTLISPLLARWIIVAFCIPLAVVPAVQIFLEATGRHKAQLITLFQNAPTRENLHQFEQDVAKNSVFKEFVQPRVQLAISETTGFGNTFVYIGRDTVLFLRSGLDFVTGRGILDPGRLRARKKQLVDAGQSNAQPDPRPAILDFDAACKKAGVRLVVVPIPDKVTVMPTAAGLNPGQSPEAVVNVDYPRFVAELREAGVDVYDPLTVLSKADEPGRYLEHDTHWTPECMALVAKAVAGHVRETAALSSKGSVRFAASEMVVSRVGDLVDMLGLPADQSLFLPQVVRILRTIDPKTGASAVAPSADVVLLGDSFSNIYTAKEMGWGEGAGFGPTLARYLQRPVDAIVINGKGASGTRAELARRPEGLSGKRVIIWEFAVRELVDASWDVIPVPAAPATSTPTTPTTTTTTRPGAKSPFVIEGTIEVTSKVPEPNAAPYPDCLTYLVMRVDKVVEGQYDQDRVLAVFWAMKKNVWLPPARYQRGQRLRVKLIPINQADESVKSGQRADDTADYTHRPYFVVEEQVL
jgi:alginate O-acetyltransferase complex protein AlgJ